MIIGTPYVDLGGKSLIRNLTRSGEYCELEYHKRGWSSANSFRVDGEVYNSKKEVVYKIDGKWSEKLFLIHKKTNHSETIWVKNPYPENWVTFLSLFITFLGIDVRYDQVPAPIKLFPKLPP